MHQGSRIQDGKNSNLGSGIQDGKNLDPRSWIRDGKQSDPGSRIRDKHPRSAKLEISSPNLLGLKEPNNNQTLCGKGILGMKPSHFYNLRSHQWLQREEKHL
jgi:hypothetical protein